MKNNEYSKNKARYLILKKLLERQTKYKEDNPYYTLTSIADQIPYDIDYGRVYLRDVLSLLNQFIEDKVLSRVTLERLDGGIVGDAVRINTKEIVKRELGSLEGVFSFESSLK